MKQSLRKWFECTVHASDGEIGPVDDFYFDDITWSLRYIVARPALLSLTQNVMIAVTAAQKPDVQGRVCHVNLTSAQVHGSPGTDMSETVTREHEIELYEYYDWPVYWTGGFYIPPIPGINAIRYDDTGTAPERPAAGVRKIDPRLHSIRDLTGASVYACDGTIGRIADYIVDEDTWDIHYLVVKTQDWVLDRLVLLSPKWLTRVDWAGNKIFTDISIDAVRNSPAFNPTEPLDNALEEDLLRHFKKPEVMDWVFFRFHTRAGMNVNVAGTFNNWDPASIRLGDNGRGVYTAAVILPPGRYEYKFIVNGEWCNAPEGGEQVPNPFGSTNSVLNVRRAASAAAHPHTFQRRVIEDDPPLWRPPGSG